MKTANKRQQAFAYLYAMGLTAAEAARQAGYPPATCNTNAHRIPKGKHMASLIQQQRQAQGIIMLEAMPAIISRLMQQAHQPGNNREAIRAIRQLHSIYLHQQQERERQLERIRQSKTAFYNRHKQTPKTS